MDSSKLYIASKLIANQVLSDVEYRLSITLHPGTSS